jgi:hypothetical protein
MRCGCKTLRQLTCLMLFSLLLGSGLSGCAKSESVEIKLDRADALLSKEGGNPTNRGLARDLYWEALLDAKETPHLRRAHFGLGMTYFLDIVHTALPPPSKNPQPADENPPPAVEPSPEEAEETMRLARRLLHELLDGAVSRHFAKVIDADEFTFVFENLQFEVEAEGGKTRIIDLSGAWDLTEIRLIYGLFQTIVGTLDAIFLYEKLPRVIGQLVLHPATLPAFPAELHTLPEWTADLLEGRGLSPLPWNDPHFGQLVPGGAMALLALRDERILDGLAAMENGLIYLRTQGRQVPERTFSASNYLSSMVKIFSDSVPIQMAVGLIPLGEVEDTFAALQASIGSTQTAFIAPPFVWSLLDTGLATLPYFGPTDPVCLGIPGLRLGRLFERPLALTTGEQGIFPHTREDGRFFSLSEQERWTDLNGNGQVDPGEFLDEGVDGIPEDGASARPGAANNDWDEPIALRGDDACAGEDIDISRLPALAQRNPFTTKIDPPNGIVDPVYLFFPNPSFNGLLTPLAEENGTLSAGSADLSNGQLMRLFSSLLWIVSAL